MFASGRNGLMAAALLALTIAVYWPVGRFGFVAFDDDQYVYNNPVVRAGLTTAGLRYAFTSTAVGNWNPLLWISFLLDASVLGLRPGAMHVENVVLHVATGLLLWRLLSKLTADSTRSAIVAALFLAHPMHVESVAWITERKDVLSTPMLLMAVGCYVRYVPSKSEPRTEGNPGVSGSSADDRLLRGYPPCAARLKPIAWYGLMLACFTLSLVAKPMGVTLPGLLILLDVWPLKRGVTIRTVVEKIPLMLVVIADAAATIIAQHVTGATAAVGRLPIGDRVANAIVCYVIYVGKLIVPTDLAAFYPHPGDRPITAVVAAAGLLGLVTVFVIARRRRSPWLLVGWLWFVGSLVPVIGLVQVGAQSMADRYSYLPSIGLLVALVWSIPRRVGRMVGPIVIVIFAALAYRQVSVWRDTETLFTHAAAVTDRNWQAAIALGGIAYDRHDLPTAVDWFGKAAQWQPASPMPFNNLGDCYVNTDPTTAVRYYEKAVELEPTSPKYHVNLAAGLVRAGDKPRAIAELKRALSIDPNYAPARAGLADLVGH